MGKREGQDESGRRHSDTLLVLENKKGKRITANFGSKDRRTDNGPIQLYPLFNYEGSAFSPTFICPSSKFKKKAKDGAFYMRELEQRIKKQEIKPLNVLDVKPRDRPNGIYCAVCKTTFKEEYFKHTKSKCHQSNVKSNVFHEYLGKLVAFYDSKRIRKEQQEQKPTA